MTVIGLALFSIKYVAEGAIVDLLGFLGITLIVLGLIRSFRKKKTDGKNNALNKPN